MSKQLFEVPLPSGRLLRYRTLSFVEIEQNERAAGAELNEKSTLAEFNGKVAMFGMRMMVSAYTEPVKKGDAEARAKAQWKPAGDLVGAWPFDARDSKAIRRLYERDHEVSNQELDAIMGERIAVVED